MRNIALFITFSPLFIFSQSNILNARTPLDIGYPSDYEEYKLEEEYFGLTEGDEPSFLPYGYVDDKDVLFSKTTWEIISLSERVNFPLLFPVDIELVGTERRPLIHYILEDVQKPFCKIYEKDNLKDEKSLDDLEKNLVYRTIKPGSRQDPIGQYKINMQGSNILFIQNAGVKVPDSILQRESEIANYDSDNFDQLAILEEKNRLATEEIMFENNLLKPEDYTSQKFEYRDVVSYKLKGVWYFDKKLAELRYRPIAICPVIISPEDKSTMDEKDPTPIDLFWIYYPDIRIALHEGRAFNDQNTSKSITFDHLINTRRFSGFIYKEDNVYEDREIESYIKDNALMQLLESQRIKEKLRNLEQDMWSY
jgi:gliding motility associated protien GldN